MLNMLNLLKYILLIFMFVIFTPFSSSFVFAKDYTKIASFKKDTLTITSYSKSWTEDKLKQLYNELIKNVTSNEFTYLKNIEIYPDSPMGVNGHYFDDVNIIDSKYVYGNNSSISLYNGEKYNTVALMAPILSHEYGHHYITFNMLEKENIYYNDIENSKYAKIRKIDSFPIYYIGSSATYEYHWDIIELLADDYVQLLGSPYAKLSKDYKSSDELVYNKNFNNSGVFFNLKPALNPYIELASKVPGLYSYLLELGGYTNAPPLLKKEPILSKLEIDKDLSGEPTYKIKWTEASGNGPFEYTLIMYPSSNPFSPIPLKTVRTGEKLEAIFGSYSVKDKNNSLVSISHLYQGEFKIKLFIKDSKGFIYDTDAITFDFDKVPNLLQKDTTTEKISTQSTYKDNSVSKTNSKNNGSNNTIIGPQKPNNNDLTNISFS